MSRRYEDQPWYAEAKRSRAAEQQRMESVARSKQPYRAEPECTHPLVIEVTCGFQRPNADAIFNIRGREFVCGICGVGLWPEDNRIRANAPRLPRCTSPVCDCEVKP